MMEQDENLKNIEFEPRMNQRQLDAQETMRRTNKKAKS